jgi:hypothetical protein
MAFALLCAAPGTVDLIAPYAEGVECCDEDAACSSEQGCTPDCTDCACCTPPSATLAAAARLRALPAPSLEQAPRTTRDVDAPGYPVAPFRPPAG